MENDGTTLESGGALVGYQGSVRIPYDAVDHELAVLEDAVAHFPTLRHRALEVVYRLSLSIWYKLQGILPSEIEDTKKIGAFLIGFRYSIIEDGGEYRGKFEVTEFSVDCSTPPKDDGNSSSTWIVINKGVSHNLTASLDQAKRRTLNEGTAFVAINARLLAKPDLRTFVLFETPLQCGPCYASRSYSPLVKGTAGFRLIAIRCVGEVQTGSLGDILGGIAIPTDHVEHENEQRHCVRVDRSRHADYVTSVISDVAQMDGAILVMPPAGGLPPLIGPEIGGQPVRELGKAVDEHMPRPERRLGRPFLMPIEGVFSIAGCGTLVIGRVETGIVKVGEVIRILDVRDIKRTVATGVEIFRKLLDQGPAGDNIGALLGNVRPDEFECDQVLARSVSITQRTVREVGRTVGTEVVATITK